MYGWFVLGWAHEKSYGKISELAESAKTAEILSDDWDSRTEVNIISVILGILGI